MIKDFIEYLKNTGKEKTVKVAIENIEDEKVFIKDLKEHIESKKYNWKDENEKYVDEHGTVRNIYKNSKEWEDSIKDTIRESEKAIEEEKEIIEIVLTEYNKIAEEPETIETVLEGMKKYI